MAEILNEEAYAELQAKIADGKAGIRVSRSMARQFYLVVGNRNVRDLTGQSVLLEKILVIGLLLVSLIAMLASLVLIGVNFGHGAIVGIPLIGIFWTIIVGLTTEYGDLAQTVVVSALLAFAAAALPPDYLWPFEAFVASVAAYRLAHLFAQRLLAQLIGSSYDAYDMLSAQVEIVTPEEAT
jgi:hypothetical protein